MRRRVEADLNRLYAVALAFVETRRDAIDDLARRLVVACIMPGEQVRAVIARHTSASPMA